VSRAVASASLSENEYLVLAQERAYLQSDVRLARKGKGVTKVALGHANRQSTLRACKSAVNASGMQISSQRFGHANRQSTLRACKSAVNASGMQIGSQRFGHANQQSTLRACKSAVNASGMQIGSQVDSLTEFLGNGVAYTLGYFRATCCSWLVCHMHVTTHAVFMHSSTIYHDDAMEYFIMSA
jgi:hypothetical protein